MREGWWNNGYKCEDPAIIIGGSGRTGTTLLRCLIDTHSKYACGPESCLLSNSAKNRHGYTPANFKSQMNNPFGRQEWQVFAKNFEIPLHRVESMLESSPGRTQFIETFLRDYAERKGKERWAEKTPWNVLELNYIFDHFPNAIFVHAIRDGRDVMCSWFTVPETAPGGRALRGDGLDGLFDYWKRAVKPALEWRNHNRYMEIRYEDVVTTPEEALTPLLSRVGVKWEPSMLCYFLRPRIDMRDPARCWTPLCNKPIDVNRIGRWYEHMTPEMHEVFRRLGGYELNAQLGYKESGDE